MTAPPLTHHEIVRIAAPLLRRGYTVDMTATDRPSRYIQLTPRASAVPDTLHIVSIDVGLDGFLQLSRVLIHQSGLAAALSASVKDLDEAMDTFEQIPEERQIVCEGQGHEASGPGSEGSGLIPRDGALQGSMIMARSYTLEGLEPDRSGRRPRPSAQLVLQFAVARTRGLELRVDISTGGAMPADLRVLCLDSPPAFLPLQLASGRDTPFVHPAVVHQALQRTDTRQAVLTTPKTVAHSPMMIDLPDDFLAVLGPQWRPLRSQGDHWKGVLRTLGREPGRTGRAERFLTQSIHHAERTLRHSPASFHERQRGARWRAYVRRLQPLMALLGVLAVMPLSWLLVSNGAMVLHPLTLGLSPLLMVGVIVLTAREIPVIEIPPLPKPLHESSWKGAAESAP